VSLCQGDGIRLQRNKEGAVILLVALFLPVFVLCIGMVTDIALVLTVRKCVQNACDLGTLAGCQELDWELLSEGIVALRENQAKTTAVEIAQANLDGMQNLFQSLRLTAEVANVIDNEPTIGLGASCRVKTVFLKWLPGLENGVLIHVFAESSVVERTEW